MSRNYKFHNPEGLYFISFAVVGWLDVFIRNEYKEILSESLRFCKKNRGMKYMHVKPCTFSFQKHKWTKINYVHQNPVEAGLVFNAEDYIYSSAIDYSDEKGLLDNIVVFRMF